MDTVLVKEKPGIIFLIAQSPETSILLTGIILKWDETVKSTGFWEQSWETGGEKMIQRSLKLTVYLYILILASYKIWYNYLKQRRRQVRGKSMADPLYEDVNNAFERALVFMHKV